MQTPLEATLSRLSGLKEDSIVYYQDDKLQVQKKPCWLLGFTAKKAATDEEKTKALLPLFKEATYVPAACLPGLRYCQSHFQKLPASAQEVTETLAFCTRFLTPANVTTIPVEVLQLIKGFIAFRISRTVRNHIPLSKVFQEQKIHERATDGEPRAVRRLATYLSLQIGAKNVSEAKCRFEAFYNAANRAAKKLFWRAIFCTNLFEQFKTLLPLTTVTDLPLKCKHTFAIPEAVVLIEGCPNLERAEIVGGTLESGAEKVSQALLRHGKLQHLALRTSFKGGMQHTVLPPELPKFTSLPSLHIEYLYFNSDSRKLLESFSSARSLTLSTVLGSDAMATIGKLNNLEELSLEVQCVSYSRIEQEVTKLTNLTKLTLKVVEQPDTTCSFVTRLLEKLPKLTHLVLHNFFDGTSEELEALRFAIEQKAQLETFSIRLNTSLPVELAKTLLTKVSLVRLGLVVNAISGFCKALETTADQCQLQELLYGQRSPQANLYAQIARLPQLHTLKVMGEFTDRNAKELQMAPALRKFSSDIRYRPAVPLSNDGLDDLLQIKTLQRCTLLARNAIDTHLERISKFLLTTYNSDPFVTVDTLTIWENPHLKSL